MAALLVIGMALACGPAPGAPAAAPKPAAAPPSASAVPAAAHDSAAAEWQALVRAAEEEGRVVVYGAPGKEWRQFLSDAFAQAYPRITIEYYGLGGSEAGNRIMAEQNGGIFAGDVYVGGPTTVNYTLLPGGALLPVRDALILPEVLDQSLWWQGRHFYADEGGQHDFLFAPSVNKPIGYN